VPIRNLFLSQRYQDFSKKQSLTNWPPKPV
jgi:hypothetical protein